MTVAAICWVVVLAALVLLIGWRDGGEVERFQAWLWCTAIALLFCIIDIGGSIKLLISRFF